MEIDWPVEQSYNNAQDKYCWPLDYKGKKKVWATYLAHFLAQLNPTVVHSTKSSCSWTM
jgi:hypothetical protein